MEYAFIKTQISDRKGTIILNRPDKKNALNANVVMELKDAFSQLQQSKDVKVIILRASGTVFSAGADLAYLQLLQKNSYEDNLKDSNHLKELYLQIYTSQKPVIAQVQGHAIAGGCGLAAVCDFVFSSNTANFGYTEVRIGFIPALVMVFLLRKIGEGRAKELLLGGNLIDAVTAQQYGLINYITTSEDLEPAVESFADALVTKNSASSMRMTKEMITGIGSMSLDQALTYAAEMNAKARSTEDCKKGIEAFLNKESLMW
jgi:methylglutaconyl-CoA hydratase